MMAFDLFFYMCHNLDLKKPVRNKTPLDNQSTRRDSCKRNKEDISIDRDVEKLREKDRLS